MGGGLRPHVDPRGRALPAAGLARRRRRCSLPAVRGLHLARRRAAVVRCPGSRSPALVGYAVLALLILAARAGPRPRDDRRASIPSGPASACGSGPPSGSSTRPGPGCSPLYSSALTPWWLRLLGARIGKGVEASTVLLIPKFAQVNDHAFLADDTLIGCYELGGGWIRVEHVKIGKRAFVGNSGMAAAGRKVPKASLVAVLSAAPRRSQAKAGSSWLGSPPTKLRRVSGDTRLEPHLRPAAAAAGPARRRRDRPPGADAGQRAAPRRRRRVPAGAPPVAPAGRGPARRPRDDRRRPRRRAGHRAGEVGPRRPAPPRGASAVVRFRLAQRAGGHLHRGPRRPLVRVRHPGHGRPQRLAAHAGRADRERRLV